MRCEDFPCCGHAGDPGGCPDFSRTVRCRDCGKYFHPDQLTEKFCYNCQNDAEDDAEYYEGEEE